MKRDMKLIFEILDYVARTRKQGENVPIPHFEGYTPEEVMHHVKLCMQACFITIQPIEIELMTSLGYKQLEKMREEGYRQTATLER